MQLGIVGLGRMGMNMAIRLLEGKHDVAAYNRTYAKTEELVKLGAKGAGSLKELAQMLKPPRIVWLMLPAGPVVDEYINEISRLLSKGDIIIDGGNTYYKEDLRHAEELKGRGIRFLDAGVSGGIWGLKLGYCTMIGGEKQDFDYLEPILKILAPKDGYYYCGNTGAGHFVKMVHNGIEYGMLAAYAEGFEILQASPYRQDMGKIAHLWNQGSVVRSWMLELAEKAFAGNSDLAGVQGYVEDSGEGRWTVQQAVETGVPAPIITLALFQRFRSREEDAYADKFIAALRKEFGGHAVVKKGDAKPSGAAGAGAIKPASPDKNLKIPG